MQGCRWQEKSFSVAVKESHSCVCRQCNKNTDGRYKHNGDILCHECYTKLPSKPFVSGMIYNTDKDQKYEFVTDMFNGKPIQVKSHRHYKSLLKKYGMVDASIKEVHQEADFRKRITAEDLSRDRKKAAEQIFARMKERGDFRRRF